MKYNLEYGSATSKKVQKQVFDELLCDTLPDGRVYKKHSDIHLLLRQQDLQKSIGIDVLKTYFENLISPAPLVDRSNLTDEQLFKLIEPKLHTITDMYQFSKYLRDNEDAMKEAFNKLSNIYNK